jgi:hypothetical protein
MSRRTSALRSVIVFFLVASCLLARVAFLAREVLLGSDLTVRPPYQPMHLEQGTWLIAAVRIEARSPGTQITDSGKPKPEYDSWINPASQRDERTIRACCGLHRVCRQRLHRTAKPNQSRFN